MPNDSTANSSLDYTSGHHCVALFPLKLRKSAFVIPIGKIAFKKVPFHLVQAPIYSKQLINEVCSESNENTLNILD